MTVIECIEAAQLAPSGMPDPGDLGALKEAWRQVHYAAQAVSEVGKLWATPKSDDSHTSLGWDDAGSLLTSRAECGPSLLWGALSISSMRLGVNLDAPTTDKAISLEGRTLEDALEFVRQRGRELVGEIRQESVPAPDLPDHPLGQGARFEIHEPAALARLERLYGSVASMLEQLRSAVGASASQVQCWPHHFDIATLIVVSLDEAGQPDKTIGVGLTPPDSLSREGYLYVSPWKAGGTPAGEGEIRHGAWHDHMAVLELGALLGLDETARATAVEEFVTSALHRCWENLQRE